MLEVQNSHHITFDGIHYAHGAELLLRVTGDRSKDIRLTTNADTRQAKRDVELGPKLGKETVGVAAR